MDVLLWFSIFSMFYNLPAVKSCRGKLLFASSNSIMEVDLDTRNVTALVAHGKSVVYSLDYDYKNRYVYFPRFDLKDIVRFPYPSQSISLQHVVNTSIFPAGVVVDSANDHVYWVNHSDRKLSRCNLDGTNIVVLFSVTDTFMIRLDLTNRWLYIGYDRKGISKSRFDLSDFIMIANFTSPAYAMDIDLVEQKMYWINYDGDIQSVNVDGSDVKTIISTNSPSVDYVALGVLGCYIYHNNYNQLVMRNKSQESTITVLYSDTKRINSVYVFKSTGICLLYLIGILWLPVSKQDLHSIGPIQDNFE